ncbi:uncharacterized protein LOC117641269 [Thrips palmi]|uniref:Uncharacterized protein LOC117641269 n=1 Tax=Thrips palmi TaxID=161013 RepID=A0A6P8YD85_THRPL|nr:uncharacterized protein LOC117641269 [Thrips palmi]
MARLSTLVFAAAVALALVCCTTSAPASEETAVLNHNLGFSVEGIVTCLAMLGLAGMSQAVSEIIEKCEPLGNGLKYRVCALSKLAKLGPEYLECVIES